MAKSTAAEIKTLMTKLHQERQTHVDAVNEIDATFAKFGITPESKPRRGRPKKKPGRPVKATKKKSTRKKRGSFKKTAEQVILDMLKNGKKLTGSEINQKWSQAGRGGKADNTLSKLVKEGKLNRENIEGQRGSRYSKAA